MRYLASDPGGIASHELPAEDLAVEPGRDREEALEAAGLRE